MKKLIDMLVLKGGAIVSTASLSLDQIQRAKVREVMFIDANGYGFVWLPKDEMLDWSINDNQTPQP